MKRYMVIFFIFFLIGNIYSNDKDFWEMYEEMISHQSFDEEIMNLEKLYNAIITNHCIWNDVINRYHIIINYEDILKMERRNNAYYYRNMVFQKNIANEEEYLFQVTLSPFRLFRVIFNYSNGDFIYQSYDLLTF